MMFEAWRCVVLKYSSVNRVMDPSRGRGVGQALECTTNLRLKKGREAGLRFFPVGVVGSGGLRGGRLRGALVSALVTSGISPTARHWLGGGSGEAAGKHHFAAWANQSLKNPSTIDRPKAEMLSG